MSYKYNGKQEDLLHNTEYAVQRSEIALPNLSFAQTLHVCDTLCAIFLSPKIIYTLKNKF